MTTTRSRSACRLTPQTRPCLHGLPVNSSPTMRLRLCCLPSNPRPFSPPLLPQQQQPPPSHRPPSLRPRRAPRSRSPRKIFTTQFECYTTVRRPPPTSFNWLSAASRTSPCSSSVATALQRCAAFFSRRMVWSCCGKAVHN